jgi:hypothetical protein
VVSDREQRYRRAAADVLGQLDWCIRYLARIGKPEIAAAMRRNRDQIMRTLGGVRSQKRDR